MAFKIADEDKRFDRDGDSLEEALRYAPERRMRMIDEVAPKGLRYAIEKNELWIASACASTTGSEQTEVVAAEPWDVIAKVNAAARPDTASTRQHKQQRASWNTLSLAIPPCPSP